MRDMVKQTVNIQTLSFHASSETRPWDIGLKVSLHEIFDFNWFSQKNPSELLINHLKYL
jgi:hypothetical protein